MLQRLPTLALFCVFKSNFANINTGLECLDTHDIFGEDYEGSRTLTEDGKRCQAPCRGFPGTGPVCPVHDTALNRTDQETCAIHFCGKYYAFSHFINIIYLKKISKAQRTVKLFLPTSFAKYYYLKHLLTTGFL